MFIKFKTIAVSDERLESLVILLVDLFVGREQQHLMAGMSGTFSTRPVRRWAFCFARNFRHNWFKGQSYMATVITPLEQTTLLRNISWATYRSLLVDYQDSSAPRLTFDRGLLQIMSPSTRHERLNRRLATFVEVVLEVRKIEFDNVGSNTFKREDLQRGFEPDSSFYIQSVESVSDREQIDLAVDPPPDVVIVIDITHPSLDKLPIFAAVGVPEVWRCDGSQVVILELTSGNYVEATESVALPRVTSEVLTRFMQASEQQKRTIWLRDVRAWARMK